MANPQRRTYTQLITSLRYVLDDGSSMPRWTSAELLDHLNHAKDRVFSEVRKERKDYFLSTRKSTDGSVTILGESYATSNLAISASTTIDLTLPPDFVELRTFSAITSNYEFVAFKQRMVTDNDFRVAATQTQAASPSTFYCAITNERTLSIRPMSDTALDTKLVYVFQPQDLDASSNTTLQMPYPLYAAVEAYAAAYAFEADDDPRAAVRYNIARDIVASVIGGDDRQSQDGLYVESADVAWL